PVTLHALFVGCLVGVAPDFLDAVGLHLQQDAAGTVGLGNEDAVAHYDRTTGVNALKRPRPPWVLEDGFASCRVDAEQAAAGEEEAPAPALDGRRHWAGVSGQIVAGLVPDFAGELVECDQGRAVALEPGEGNLVAAPWAAADHDEKQVAL